MPLNIENFTTLDGHLTRIMSDLPMTFFRKGISYTNVAIRASQNMAQVLEVGGVDSKIEYSVYIRRSLLPESPVIGEIWRIMERNGWSIMKVIDVKDSPDNAQLITVSLGYAHIQVPVGVIGS